MGLLANQVPLLINHVGSSIVQILVGASGPFLFANASILGLGVSVSLICFKSVSKCVKSNEVDFFVVNME